jgi:hypothetical protein
MVSAKHRIGKKRGHYLEYLHHRAQYNEKFYVHFETSTDFIGTSHDIQKNLIPFQV